MNVDRLPERGAQAIAGDSRKAWARPSLTPLRAGRAEAIPGSLAFDGSLEMIGS